MPDPDTTLVPTEHHIEVYSYGADSHDGYLIKLTSHDSTNGTEAHTSVTIHETCAFVFAEYAASVADDVRGEIPETDGAPLIFLGEDFEQHCYRSFPEPVPDEIEEWLTGEDLVVLANVDGGWDNWDNRPGFSEAYIDFTEAKVNDTPSEM